MPANDQIEPTESYKEKYDAAFEFEIRKYDRDREHELELNRFTHAFELERVKLLFLLNGGAFTLLVTLVDKQNGVVDKGLFWLVAASAAWLLGLLCAAQAAQRALDTQRSFMQAYHRRRRAVEWRQLKKGGEDDKTLERIVGKPPNANSSQNNEGNPQYRPWHSMCMFIHETRKKFKPQGWVELPGEDKGHYWPCDIINTFHKRLVRWIVPNNWGPVLKYNDDRNFDDSADDARKVGEKAAGALKIWVRSSVILFVVGVVSQVVV
ncbi:hypothetical protein GCM10007973_26760 [Polymorphobacter multimanifer]|uniref:Uncharacterized protein n=1 Tax=Polymorphobacter multimanifer TaxID=1070431 RepID=A0A841LAY3_9SPHN|nr:hypothetical protein [Polymorphobacter multimanifer]MBB6228811.1 hypothetical protein [Polymorphobacter multimanifer]GGI89039.1 hypothetical protein GCM10007973_26760 [Polymorphobacter multimanifer]